MNENSYLNPADIRMQCEEAIGNLEEDNRIYGIMQKNIMEFITEPTLVSEAFDALKQQMFDYLSVLQVLKQANEADISDFRLLKLMAVGQELDGSVILEQKEVAWSLKKASEENAEKYKKKAAKEKSVTLQLNYSAKAAHYTTMAAGTQRLYEEWQKREDMYDGFERVTCGLFEEGAAIRATVENAMNGMQGAFQNGSYVCDMNSPWRNELGILLHGEKITDVKNSEKEEVKIEIPKKIQTKLLKMGYTLEEIKILYLNGVALTDEDIRNLKLTVGTERIYRTEDAKALMYDGKVYYIYVPNHELAYIGEPWKVDWKKELTKVDFDVAAGILGISLEDIPKEDIFVDNSPHKVQSSIVSREDNNVATASLLHLVMGIESFMVSALKHTEINLVFESSGAIRRVTMGVGDSQTRLKFQQIDYNMPINTYQSANDFMGEKYASDYAQGIYQTVTGESVPDKEKAYTITGTLDEGHRDCNISGYLSYSETGELLYTPLVLPGDKAYVATCMKYTGYFPNTILEFTDMLPNPVMAEEEVRIILEKALEKKNGE